MEMSTKQTQFKNNSKVKQNQRSLKTNQKAKKDRRTRRNNRSSRSRNIAPTSSLLVTNTIRHKELWGTLSFLINSNDNVKKMNFDYNSFPPWFDKVRKLYEMYQLHYVRIYTKATAATTTTGTYVLSYNTNEAQKSASRTCAALAGQQNAKQDRLYENLSVVIPASSLKNFRTNTPTDGSESWAFNVELGVDGNSVAVNIPVWIEYIVTMRNPQV